MFQWLARLLGFDSPRPRALSREGMWALVMSIDLEPVIDQVVTKLGRRRHDVEAAALDYRRFLYLIKRYPGKVLVPWTVELDDVWHLHIQDSRRYMEDCRRLFGAYLHHNPDLPRGTTRHRVGLDFTRSLLDTEFGSHERPTPTPVVKDSVAIGRDRDRIEAAAGSASCGGACTSYVPLVSCTAGLSDGMAAGSGGYHGDSGYHAGGDHGHGGDAGGGHDSGGASCGGSSCGGGGCGGGGD